MTPAAALIVFFGLAYAWAWIVFVPMVIFHAAPPWIILATLGPTVAAVVAHRLTEGDYRAIRVHATSWRTLGATVGVVLMLLAFVVLPSVTTVNPRALHWRIFTSASVYNYSTLLGGPLFEEMGWRGFALPRLEARFGPVRGTMLLALLWAGWHTPLFFYPGWITAGPAAYVLIVTGASFLLTYGANLARFSVLTPIAMHAAFNTASKLLQGLFTGTAGPQIHISFEWVLALSGLFTAGILVLGTRGQLGYDRSLGVSPIPHHPSCAS
jgi:membrane protease YdiL (CAAX protease family)